MGGLEMAGNAQGPSGPHGQRPSKAKNAKSSQDTARAISRRTFVGRSAGAALAIGGLLASSKARADSGTVVVMAWENYVDPEIQKRFQAATGVTMRGIPADSDQDMFTKLQAGGGDQYDI